MPPFLSCCSRLISLLMHCNKRERDLDLLRESLPRSRVGSPPSESSSWWLERMKKSSSPQLIYIFNRHCQIDGFCKTNKVEKALLLLEE